MDKNGAIKIRKDYKSTILNIKNINNLKKNFKMISRRSPASLEEENYFLLCIC